MIVARQSLGNEPSASSGALRVLFPVVLAAFSACIALVSANPWLTLVAFVAGALILLLLRRPLTPQALLYSVAYQWLQASILLISADASGVSLSDPSNGLIPFRSDLFTATLFTLLGLVASALGMRLALGRPPSAELDPTVDSHLRSMPVGRLFLSTVIAIIASRFLVSLGYMVPGILEPMRAFVSIRWGFYYFLAYTVFLQRRGYVFLLTVFLIEFGVGFLGFFGDFKTVLVMTGLAAVAQPNAFRGHNRSRLVFIGVLALSSALFWSTIKDSYRVFLNQGTGGQVILVTAEEQAAMLREMALSLDAEQVGGGLDRLLKRISYVEYFGGAILTVPHEVPHENGKLWGETITHVLTPRLFMPSKKAISDSDRTRAYSGVAVAGVDQGTSISLGYIAESYIDFGFVGMFVPLFLYGLLLGWGYRWLTNNDRCSLLLSGSVASLIVEHASVLEQSNLKLVGKLVMGFVLLFLVYRVYGAKLERALAGRTEG